LFFVVRRNLIGWLLNTVALITVIEKGSAVCEAKSMPPPSDPPTEQYPLHAAVRNKDIEAINRLRLGIVDVNQVDQVVRLIRLDCYRIAQ
jgi:hypothetical protein